MKERKSSLTDSLRSHLGETTCEAIREYCQSWGVTEFQGVLDSKVLDEAELAQHLANNYGLSLITQIDSLQLDLEVAERLGFSQCLAHLILPIVQGEKRGALVGDPVDYAKLRQNEQEALPEILAVGGKTLVREAVLMLFPVGWQVRAMASNRK